MIFSAARAGKPGSFGIGSCSNSFNIRGNEHILDALRNQVEGGPARLVGRVLRSNGAYSHEGGLGGVSVAVEAEGLRHETISDGLGRYEFRGLAAGRYRIEVARDGYVADAEYNKRWSGLMVLNKAENRIEPDKEERGTVLVSRNVCAVWDLAMWPAGSIAGTIRGEDGRLLGGVTVQAFDFDRRGERESRPLRSATSDGEGRYRLDLLPAGAFIVGVNGQTFRDEDAYPPTRQTMCEIGKY